MNFWIGRRGASLLASVMGVALAADADAGFQVTFRVGGEETTIVDNGAGDDDATANRIVVLSETVGGYEFNVSLSSTNTPGGGLAFVDHGTNSIIGTGATTVQVVVSANDFLSPTAPPPITVYSGATAQFLALTDDGATANISYAAYVDTANNLSTTGVGTPAGSGGPVLIVAPGGNADLSDTQTIGGLSSEYALNLVLTAQLNSDGVNRIDLDGTMLLNPLNAVPAPAGLVLAFSALPALGIGYFRRRQATKAKAQN